MGREVRNSIERLGSTIFEGLLNQKKFKRIRKGKNKRINKIYGII